MERPAVTTSVGKPCAVRLTRVAFSGCVLFMEEAPQKRRILADSYSNKERDVIFP